MMPDTPAAADAGTGNFPQAITAAQRALQLANGQNNAALVAAIGAQLESYEACAPWRETKP